MKLGRYEIVRELGKGAMGVVYLANDPVIGRLIALKTIRRTGDLDENEQEFRERFRREAQSAGRLSHKSIVTIYDISSDTESGSSFIAMEYVEGRDLKEILSSEGRLQPQQAAELIAQVADALDYAHARGVVHRDIKPANIIRTVDGTAKVMDFGIAKIASGATNLTAPGQFLGTPNYMAPEQIKATARVDGRADIFALGVVLYESITGKKPFAGDSLTSVSHSIVHTPHQPLREIDATIPEAYEVIVSRCLEKKPDRRYQTAADLATHLRSAANGEPLAELPDDTVSFMVAAGSRQELIPTREERLSASTLAHPAPADDSVTMIDPGAALPDETASGMRRPVSTFAGVGIIVLMLAILGITAALIWSKRVDVPEVDSRRESTIAWQASLQREAAALMSQGDIDAAYEKYRDLARLAPDSPEVARALEKLEAIRAERMAGEQESSEEKSTEEKAVGSNEEAPAAGTTTAEPRTTSGVGTDTAPERPSRTLLLTQFSPEVRDGAIDVFVDGRSLLHEDLWVARALRRRAPRSIAVYSQIDPGQHEVKVVVTIPTLGITASRTVQLRMEPGQLTRLLVTLDTNGKTIAVDLS